MSIIFIQSDNVCVSKESNSMYMYVGRGILNHFTHLGNGPRSGRGRDLNVFNLHGAITEDLQLGQLPRFQTILASRSLSRRRPASEDIVT